MNDRLLRVEHTETTTVLVLSRAERRNALNAATLEALAAAVASIASDPDLRSLAIVADGPAFSVGADVAEFAEHQARGSLREHVLANADLMSRVISTVAALAVPTVVGVQGPAVGAGLALALACDVRVGSIGCTFVPAFVGVGIPPDSGASWLLSRAVGPGRARDILLCNRRVGAEEALALGLVSELAADARTRAITIAAELAAGPATALAATKRLLDRREESLAERLAAERVELEAALATVEPAEGIRSFAERRKPRW